MTEGIDDKIEAWLKEAKDKLNWVINSGFDRSEFLQTDVKKLLSLVRVYREFSKEAILLDEVTEGWMKEGRYDEILHIARVAEAKAKEIVGR